MNTFNKGYKFFIDNLERDYGINLSENYLKNINLEIEKFEKELSNFEGFKTPNKQLKGDIAEFWHSNTFNINAALKDSRNRAYTDRSHEFASPDIKGNFGKDFGLKYYRNGEEGVKAQSLSIFQKFSEYKAKGGKENIEEFLKNRNLSNNDNILNDPIYKGQIRVIPREQLEEAIKWLKRKINEESSKRSEQVFRYQETLKLLDDRLRDGKGVESIPLSTEEALKLSELSKLGKVDLKNFGISIEDLMKYEYIMQQGFRAGLNSAIIKMVLEITPKLYLAIEYLIKTGEIDKEELKKNGFATLSSGAKGFLYGSLSASLIISCKSGIYGNVLKTIHSSVLGAISVILLNTIKNSYKVSKGEMNNRELVNELIREMFISSCSLIGGGITQGVIEIPILGFMLGSFMGAVLGTFIYETSYNAVISYCTDSGFTFFGLVEQNYELSKEILQEIGIKVFEYEKFSYNKFEHKKFEFKKFNYNKFKYNRIKIKILRRGVIGVNKIGYVE